MPGKILLICKLKGGAGATTTSRELAVAAVAAGLKVALIDLDGQGGLTRWWSRTALAMRSQVVSYLAAGRRPSRLQKSSMPQ